MYSAPCCAMPRPGSVFVRIDRRFYVSRSSHPTERPGLQTAGSAGRAGRIDAEGATLDEFARPVTHRKPGGGGTA